MTTLTTEQYHRAAGVLLGQACGDALGVPYEFSTPPDGEPRMLGGGLGPYAPGEWSDDTQMAVCVAEVAATGADLTALDALDPIAGRFLDWVSGGASDVGIQTRIILDRTAQSGEPGAARMLLEARNHYLQTGRAAGNGALMRTAVVGLTRLGDRAATAAAARTVAELTHADPLAGDSCVIWSELVRRAVVDDALEPHATLDLLPPERRSQWAHLLDEATDGRHPRDLGANGFTVTALQAALAGVTRGMLESDRAGAFRVGLSTAVQAGDDTDTVAAIAGGLLGALCGVSAVPFEWRRAVHGWPGLRARDLVGLALRTATGDSLPGRGWPLAPSMALGDEPPMAVPHPADPDVLLGTVADIAGVEQLGVRAVVSLSRVGTADVPDVIAPEDHHEVWLLDDERPSANPLLEFVLDDAAAAVAAYRAEGKRVLVHCVAAQQRTPSVAVRYAVRLGHTPDAAARAVQSALPSARGSGRLWRVATRPADSSSTAEG